MSNSVNLEVGLKDGKNTVKAYICTESADVAIQEYDRLLDRFQNGPAPSPAKGKKTDAETEAEEAETAVATEKNVVEIKTGSRAAKKIFAQQAIELNEIAIEWAKRFGVVIQEYKDFSPQQIVEHLNFKKPMATMEIEELQEVIKLIKSTLIQYADNNAGAKAFLKVVDVIDGLKTGTPEEWTEARAAISNEDWAYLGQPGNVGMLDFAKAQLENRQNLLQAANIAAEAV
jgi:hypothetical protein